MSRAGTQAVNRTDARVVKGNDEIFREFELFEEGSLAERSILNLLIDSDYKLNETAKSVIYSACCSCQPKGDVGCCTICCTVCGCCLFPPLGCLCLPLYFDSYCCSHLCVKYIAEPGMLLKLTNPACFLCDCCCCKTNLETEKIANVKEIRPCCECGARDIRIKTMERPIYIPSCQNHRDIVELLRTDVTTQLLRQQQAIADEQARLQQMQADQRRMHEALETETDGLIPEAKVVDTK